MTKKAELEEFIKFIYANSQQQNCDFCKKLNLDCPVHIDYTKVDNPDYQPNIDDCDWEQKFNEFINRLKKN